MSLWSFRRTIWGIYSHGWQLRQVYTAVTSTIRFTMSSYRWKCEKDGPDFLNSYQSNPKLWKIDIGISLELVDLHLAQTCRWRLYMGVVKPPSRMQSWRTIQGHREQVSKCSMQVYRFPKIYSAFHLSDIPDCWSRWAAYSNLRSHLDIRRSEHSSIYEWKHGSDIQEREISIVSGKMGAITLLDMYVDDNERHNLTNYLQDTHSTWAAGGSLNGDGNEGKLHQLRWAKQCKTELSLHAMPLQSAGLLHQCLLRTETNPEGHWLKLWEKSKRIAFSRSASSKKPFPRMMSRSNWASVTWHRNT